MTRSNTSQERWALPLLNAPSLFYVAHPLLFVDSFLGKGKVAKTLHRHVTCLGDTMTFDIKASMVERIIGGMCEDDVLLSDSGSDSDDDGAKDSVARKAERKACQKRGSLRLFVKDDADPEWYHVSINNATRLELAMDMVAIGMSFRHTTGVIQLACEGAH